MKRRTTLAIPTSPLPVCSACAWRVGGELLDGPRARAAGRTFACICACESPQPCATAHTRTRRGRHMQA
eukprot:4739352-Pleurochrysis_carterae.AAC.1